MSLSRLLRASLVVGAASAGAIIACGGGGGTKSPDAKVFLDAHGSGGGTDAGGSGSGLTGLGEKCGSGLAMCPTGEDCISLGLGGSAASTPYCTPHCLDGGSGTTNGSGQLTATVPPPDDTKCTGAYMGSVGMPQCAIILSTTPMDNPLKANTHYTAIALGCLVACGTGSGSGACPPSMTCNTAVGGICFPN